MRNRIGLIAAWALVTLIGISVTSAAVGSVHSNVTDTVAPRFTVAEQPASRAAADTTSTTTTALAGNGAVTPDAPPNTQDPAGAEADGATDSSSAPTTTAPPPDSSATPPTPPSTTSTSASPATTTTAAPASVVKSYSAIGGSVTVEVTGDVVTLLGAVPNSGFSAEEKSRDDTDKVVVEFESESHSSKITVEVQNGAIVADIDEEPEDD